MAIMLPRKPTWGEALGSGLGQGLGAGMQALASMKLQELQQARQSALLAPLAKQYNLPPEFGTYPQQVQLQLLKQASEKETMKGLQPFLNELLGQSAAIGAGPSPEASIGQMQPEAVLSEAPALQPPQETRPSLEAPGTVQKPSIELLPEQKAALATAIMSGKPANIARILSDISKESMRAKTATELAEKRAEQTSGLEQEKANRAIKKEAFATEKTNIKERGRLEKLKAMLDEKGVIDEPYLVKTFKKLGLDMLLKPGTVEAEKTIADLARRAVTASKGRISEMVFREYLKSFPNLETSPEAQSAVLDALLDLNDLEGLEAKITRDVIKEKKGLRGYELDELVGERYGDEAKKMIDKMVAKVKSGPQAGGTMVEALPEPGSVPIGTRARDVATGKWKVNKGTEWIDE